MEKVKELVPRGTHLPIEKAIDKINSWYRGWASYFRMTEYPAQLKIVEAHIKRRLRARFVAQQKRKRHLVAKLLKRGVGEKLAKRTVYRNRKTWNLSHTIALSRAYPNKWFKDKIGQVIVSDQNLDHWFDIGIWVKLT